ncbi:MAG: hypothetical protein CVV64_10655 [Candidatus Wallbacteria bacterium HGW-Wallbacteria-1]|jgi:endonuclease/exonuclease/phosphatase family metal-dependent hydrolase|uniref:Endonuclease/exonuclease/phosphatase domain-containing protein n=1 Tax=Candidatus Wallbacteria bacterium HGW-Wallbacteria-1 TaxID=2013854 RepID=A0A2N1PPC4_9BACT|nr:MAG: hypothetical protein CVV64_10655 [Candidatus Wallbacteria bacterium HGW-Wallbacteria-1]
MDFLFWNLENLFDPDDGGGPRGDYVSATGWTTERYRAKALRVASALSRMGSNGERPSLIALCEVDTPGTLQLIADSLVPEMALAVPPSAPGGYGDTALLYDPALFELRSSEWQSVNFRFQRGEVLIADLVNRADNIPLKVMVCHWKSRGGGEAYTDPMRKIAGEFIQQLIWKDHGGLESVQEQRRCRMASEDYTFAGFEHRNVLIAGDFNDDPFSESMMRYLKAGYDADFVLNQCDMNAVFLYNAAFEGLLKAPSGTNYYTNPHGTPWSMLDQIVMGPSLLSGSCGLSYQRNSFRVLTDETADERGRPRRICFWDEDDQLCWDDQGISDHFPVRVIIEKSGNG